MRKKGLLPLILGLLLLTVFALAAFVPELFTSFSQKELFTKWLPVSREHLRPRRARMSASPTP